MDTNVDQTRTTEKIDGHPPAQGREPQDGTSLPAPSHHACRAVRTTFPFSHLWSSAALLWRSLQGSRRGFFLSWVLQRSQASLVSGSRFSARLSAFSPLLMCSSNLPFLQRSETTCYSLWLVICMYHTGKASTHRHSPARELTAIRRQLLHSYSQRVGQLLSHLLDAPGMTQTSNFSRYHLSLSHEAR